MDVKQDKYAHGKDRQENYHTPRRITDGESYLLLPPHVCIDVTTYNVAGYVAQAMDSILNQTYKNLEVIVVDDHSSDGTVKLLQEEDVANTSTTDPTNIHMPASRNDTSLGKNITIQVISLQQNTNGGTGQPSNIGKESCSSSTDYIMFADGDDYMELDAVETLVGMAKSCNNA